MKKYGEITVIWLDEEIMTILIDENHKIVNVDNTLFLRRFPFANLMCDYTPSLTTMEYLQNPSMTTFEKINELPIKLIDNLLVDNFSKDSYTFSFSLFEVSDKQQDFSIHYYDNDYSSGKKIEGNHDIREIWYTSKDNFLKEMNLLDFDLAWKQLNMEQKVKILNMFS